MAVSCAKHCPVGNAVDEVSLRLAATVRGSCTTDTAVTQDEHTDYGNHADDDNAQSNNYYSSECTCGDGNACDDDACSECPFLP